MKILLLGDVHHANARNWIYAFEHYGGCKVHTWSLPLPRKGSWGKSGRVINWLIAIIKLKGFVRRTAPDIVIGYRLTSYGFLASITGHKPLVLAAQGETDVWPPGHWTTAFKAMIARFAIKRAHLIHAWAPHMAHAIYELGAEKDKVLVLHRGIDLQRFAFPATSDPQDTLVMVTTRGLAPEYGHKIIFQAIHLLRKKGVSTRLFVAGEGSYKIELQDFAEKLGISDNIAFLGRVQGDQLPHLLQRSLVYVSMPTTEGVSSSLLEGMACCCIPVVSDLPANRIWIQHGSNGFLVPPTDYTKLSDVLEEIWTRRTDFTRVLLANRRTVEEKASMEANTKIFLEKYKLLLKSCAE